MTIRTLGVLLVCLLAAGCGDEPRPQAVEAPPYATVVILDPAGRLLDIGDAPSAFLVEGESSEALHFWDDDQEHKIKAPPQDGAELLVVVPGCRPQRVALTPGRNLIRMEAGIRVRVSIQGEAPKLPDGARYGLSLVRRVDEVEGVALPEAVTLRALEAAAFEEDRPTHPQYMSIPADAVLDVLVPMPSTYYVRWHIRFPGHASEFQDKTPVNLAEGDRTLELQRDTAQLERMLKLIGRKR